MCAVTENSDVFKCSKTCAFSVLNDERCFQDLPYVFQTLGNNAKLEGIMFSLVSQTGLQLSAPLCCSYRKLPYYIEFGIRERFFDHLILISKP